MALSRLRQVERACCVVLGLPSRVVLISRLWIVKYGPGSPLFVQRYVFVWNGEGSKCAFKSGSRVGGRSEAGHTSDPLGASNGS